MKWLKSTTPLRQACKRASTLLTTIGLYNRKPAQACTAWTIKVITFPASQLITWEWVIEVKLSVKSRHANQSRVAYVNLMIETAEVRKSSVDHDRWTREAVLAISKRTRTVSYVDAERIHQCGWFIRWHFQYTCEWSIDLNYRFRWALTIVQLYSFHWT